MLAFSGSAEPELVEVLARQGGLLLRTGCLALGLLLDLAQQLSHALLFHLFGLIWWDLLFRGGVVTGTLNQC